MLDLDGTVLEANRPPLEAAGISAADVLGRAFWDCYWWNYSAEVQARLREAAVRARDGEVVRFDVPVRVAGDRRMWIDFQLAPLRDGDGRITHLIPSAMDITARRQAEAALREADRRKDEFLATLAHELRNPLAPIRTGLDLLLRGHDDPRVLAMMNRQVVQVPAQRVHALEAVDGQRGRIHIEQVAVGIEDDEPFGHLLKDGPAAREGLERFAGIRTQWCSRCAPSFTVGRGISIPTSIPIPILISISILTNGWRSLGAGDCHPPSPAAPITQVNSVSTPV